MKKFKTTAEKRHIEAYQLRAILSDKDLISNVLLRYVHLPLGLVLALLMLLTTFLAYGSLAVPEALLFALEGISGVAFFYSFKNYRAFQQHRQHLQHITNDFVGSWIYPLLFAALFVYLSLPLGLLILSLSLAFIMLSSIHHLKVARQADHGPMDALAYSLCMTILVSLPLFGPHAQLQWSGALMMVVSGVLFVVLAMGFKRALFLEESEPAV